MNLRLLSKLKTRDAAVIYEYLFALLNGSAGQLKNLTFESIAAGLNLADVKTSRGALFTAAVVRNRFCELERVEVVSKETTEGGMFDLYVFMPYPCAVEESTTEPQNEIVPDPYNGRSLFDYAEDQANVSHSHYENENENENTKIETAPNKEYINKKQTNKQTVNSVEETIVRRETVDDVVASVDFTQCNVAKLRRLLVRTIYENGLRADLVDRAVAAVVRGYATTNELQAAVNESKDEKRLLDSTKGFRGKRKLWQTFCLRVKDWYDAADVEWVSTSPRREQQPKSVVRVVDDEDDAETITRRIISKRQPQAV